MEKHCEHKRHSSPFWAYVLIIFGILWILSKNGWAINFPGIGGLFGAIGNFFSNLAHWSAGTTFPILLFIVAIVLIAGRRFFGALLFVLLILILIPSFLVIPGILVMLLFPVILIIIGIVVLIRLL